LAELRIPHRHAIGSFPTESESNSKSNFQASVLVTISIRKQPLVKKIPPKDAIGYYKLAGENDPIKRLSIPIGAFKNRSQLLVHISRLEQQLDDIEWREYPCEPMKLLIAITKY
jgi:hypothetical protein